MFRSEWQHRDRLWRLLGPGWSLRRQLHQLLLMRSRNCRPKTTASEVDQTKNAAGTEQFFVQLHGGKRILNDYNSCSILCPCWTITSPSASSCLLAAKCAQWHRTEQEMTKGGSRWMRDAVPTKLRKKWPPEWRRKAAEFSEDLTALGNVQSRKACNGWTVERLHTSPNTEGLCRQV
jgi:hypothetical protein